MLYSIWVQVDLKKYCLKFDYWRQTKDIHSVIQFNNFLDALAVFVWKSKKKIDKISLADNQVDYWKVEYRWIKDYYISLHNSLTC